MKAVFVGGSRKLSRLNEVIRRRLGSIMDGGLWVFVGDADGADKALQKFFASHRYDRVLVYCVEGRYRNNVGHWPTKAVQPQAGARGFDYYAAKDIQMASEASFGMMLWDGVSRGTLANIRNLLVHGKPVAVYLSPHRMFRDLKHETELAELLSSKLPLERPAKVGRGALQWELPLRARGGTRATLPNKRLKLTGGLK